MRRVVGFLVTTALLLAVAAAGPACGDGEDELTLEEYFRQVESMRDDAEERMDVLVGELTADVDPDASEEEQVRVGRELMTAGLPITEDLLDKLKDLDPPALAEDGHKALLDAGADTLDALREVADRVEEVELVSELEQLFDLDILVEAEGRADEACFELQAVADANDIDANLECGE